VGIIQVEIMSEIIILFLPVASGNLRYVILRVDAIFLKFVELWSYEEISGLRI